jgi:hypothetical protein
MPLVSLDGTPECPLDEIVRTIAGRVALLHCQVSLLGQPMIPTSICSKRSLVMGLGIVAAASIGAQAQNAAAAPDSTPAVGTIAPDFTIAGATRYGLLRDSVHLSDFRGQTVVLAFFFQARTKG